LGIEYDTITGEQKDSKFLEFIANVVGGELWAVEIETNVTFSVGDVNYTIYVNDSFNNIDRCCKLFYHGVT